MAEGEGLGQFEEADGFVHGLACIAGEGFGAEPDRAAIRDIGEAAEREGEADALRGAGVLAEIA
jgi:hypothetical protein